MELYVIVRSQYLATLEMLREAIEKCPDGLWNHLDDRTKFWQIAYHALFFTHLYLQKRLDDFRPWEKHQKNAEELGPGSETTPGQEKPVRPYSQADILEYLRLCQQQVDEKTTQLVPEAESGFHWLPMNKLELQFYNIRHLQQHTGELMERMGTRAGIEVDWVGLKRD